MATNSDVNTSCCLCLSPESVKLKFPNAENAKKKIEKYLHISIKLSSRDICHNCYYSIESFHEFYERIQSAQKNLGVNSGIYNAKSEDGERTQKNGQFWSNGFNSDEKLLLLEDKQSTHEEIETKDQFPVLDCAEDEELGVQDDGETSKPSASAKSKKYVNYISDDVERKMAEFYNLKCEKCDVQFTNFNLLNKHYLSVHKMKGYIKCCKRNIRVHDKSYLRNHMMQHLHPDMCKCPECGKELSSTVTLKHHMILHKPTEQRPFQCDQCDKKFCCRTDLKNHETNVHKAVNSPNEYICDVCGKVFQKIANLRYHISSVHLPQRKFICEVCARTFTTHSGLRTHMNAAHSNVGPIQCHECSKWLKNTDTMHKHTQLHKHNIKFCCRHCNKVCNTASSLRSHLVRHSEARPFICTVCSKSFKTRTHLKTHTVQHSGGSHQKCPSCHKTFASMSNYYTHRKRMHPAGQAKVDLSAVVPMEYRILDNRRFQVEMM